MNATQFVPDWAKGIVWYQILPERFRNGDPVNDPTPESLDGAWPHDAGLPWQVHPWTSDWYARQPYEQAKGGSIWFHLPRRRYGGDLKGIIDSDDVSHTLEVPAGEHSHWVDVWNGGFAYDAEEGRLRLKLPPLSGAILRPAVQG